MKKITLMLALFVFIAGSAMSQKAVKSFGKMPTQSQTTGLKALTGEITSPSSSYVSGTTFDLTIEYVHVSADYEWVDGISLTFPSGVTVNSAINIGEAAWNSETGDGVETTWGNMTGGSGSGSISADVQWTVNITIDAGFSGDLTIAYSVIGDGYGAEPHSLAGNIVLTEAADTDLAVTAVTPNYMSTGTSATPVVTVYNNGLIAQDVFDVVVVINDGTSDVYTSTKNVVAAGLASITSTDVTMDDVWTTPADGNYTITATVTAVSDANNSNDELVIGCFVGSFFDAQAGNTTDLTYGSIALVDGTYTETGAIGTDPFPMAEEFDGTDVYRVHDDLTYGTVNPIGDYTAVGTFTGVTGTPTGLAYDHQNDIMYVCVLDGSNLPQLCTADLGTGVLTLVGTGAEGMIIGMDFANDGMLYGPGLNDNLYQIDPATGTVTLIGALGVDINYGQDVSFDFEANKLYTVTCGAVYEFGYYDLATGAFTSIADMGGDQYATFTITKDPIGPLPISLEPTNMSTDVAIDATVSATFHVNVFETDFSGINITPDPGNVTASIVDDVLTIAHDNFAFDTEYTVTIPMGSINDGSDDLAFDVVWSFTTALDPTACNDPSDAVFTDITAFTATVSWTENGPATDWNVIYGADGFDPLSQGTTEVVATDPTVGLSGLDATTTYDVYIQALCGGGIESGLAGPYQFTTDCDVATELNESFETAVPPICWDNYQAGAGTSVWIQTDANATDGTYAAFAGYEDSGSINEQWLVTGVITVPENYSLTFDATDDMASDYSSTLVVKVSTDGGTIYTDLLTIAEADVTSDTYSHFVVDVSSYGTQNAKFAFVMIDDDGDNWYLDNVKLELVSDVESNISSNISVYPNPTNNVITVANAENSNIVVLNMVGEVVASIENASANQTIDISNLASGAYFVRVNSEVFKVNVVK
ncbi:MAG: T9SS type A sorting domain-containing protein [Clostridia bacterium]|nr:T9SS type A sorting domain-containing protein [Clostridia bacterium]